MKLFSKFLIIITVIASTACQELVDPDGDLNINPNNPTETSYQNVLVTTGVGQIILQNGETSRYAGLFGGTHTGIDRQYQAYGNYSVSAGNFDGIWDDLFIHSYRNARLTEELAREEGIEGITIGIAQVHQAMALGAGTSLYGDLPFDELADIDIDNPEFENQIEVYTKIQSLLDDAIQNLESGQGRPANGADIYYEGNEQAWMEVAYTLKSRFYMHVKDYTNAYNAALNGISTFENSMYAPYGEALDASNLNWQLWEIESRQEDIVISDFLVSFIAADNSVNPNFANYRGNAKTNEAGRFEYLITTDDNGRYIPNTAENQFAGQTTPSPIVTYQENLLILAEAGFRSEGFNTGLTHLNEFRSFMDQGGYLSSDIEASNIQYEAYTAADFAAGGMENQDGLSADDALLREILEERYITLFTQIEIFNDVRRTLNETNLRVNVQPNTGSELPQRFIYAQSEIDRNENIPRPLPNLFDATPVNQ